MGELKKQTEEHENVVLLAMSTLPRNPEINTYQVEDEEKWGQTLYFKSFSQMEPHTKYVLYQLAARKERLDRIVILESKKVREEKSEDWGDETATSLFEKRIKKYLGSDEKIEVQDKLTDRLEELTETEIKPSFYQGSEDFPEFISINLDDPVFFWDAVQKILGNNKSKKRSIHLYMDMQGGDRNAISQMNAIVELLVRQKVEIQARYANNYEPKKEKLLHTIRDASREYRTYELISAMDIFARYGWGDKLEEYFRNEGKNPTKEKKLAEAIKEASLAISRCNGDGFDRAVEKIQGLEKEFEDSKSKTEMDVVYQDIKENYAPLFNPKYRYVEQIRWCLDRRFLQQAYTIFEAKMPYEFVNSGLIYYMTKKASTEEKEKFFEECNKLYERFSERLGEAGGSGARGNQRAGSRSELTEGSF